MKTFGMFVFVKLSFFSEFVYFPSSLESGTHIQRKSLLCHLILQVLVVPAAIPTINLFIATAKDRIEMIACENGNCSIDSGWELGGGGGGGRGKGWLEPLLFR